MVNRHVNLPERAFQQGINGVEYAKTHPVLHALRTSFPRPRAATQYPVELSLVYAGLRGAHRRRARRFIVKRPVLPVGADARVVVTSRGVEATDAIGTETWPHFWGVFQTWLPEGWTRGDWLRGRRLP